MKFFNSILKTVSPAFERFTARYRAVFSIEEIESSTMLQLFFWAMLFAFLLTFMDWISDGTITRQAVTNGSAVCWPYFPDCTKFYFFQALPYGYSQTTFYMALYGLILLAVYLGWKKRWEYAHLSMLVLFIWKALVMFLLTSITLGGVNYYHLLLAGAFLLLPYKEYFVSLTFVLEYFLAAVVKIDQTWILGNYFTSLQTGLPIFGNAFAPVFTNLVVLMQILGSWFLLSSHRIPQRIAVSFFATFHIYSGILVGFTFPSLALSSLLILFGPLYVPKMTPFTRRAIFGWLYIILLFAFSSPGILIVGDQRLTQEGSRFGLNLFDANHQCIQDISVYYKPSEPIKPYEWTAKSGAACGDLVCDTHVKQSMQGNVAIFEKKSESAVAWQRCNPYRYFMEAHMYCKTPSVERVSMQFDHSIDGGPFYRIVDENDICHLSYSAFSHNDWIKLPPEAPIVGYPVKNFFRYANQGPISGVQISRIPAATTTSDHLIVLNELVGNDPITPTPMQKKLQPYLEQLIGVWTLLWLLALVCGIFVGFIKRNR